MRQVRTLPVVLMWMCLFAPSAALTEQKPKLYDADVGPWRLEAEEFVWSHNVTVFDDANASGGRAVKRPGYKFILLNEMPFPRTSRPVTIYVRAWPAVPDERYQLMATDEKGERRALACFTPKADQIGRWQWMKFDPVTAGPVENRFDIEFTRALFGDSMIDCVVICTKDSLSGKALDAAPPLFNNGPLCGTPPSVNALGTMGAASMSNTGPLAAVARVSKPPVIDGKEDDACWAHAVACSGFLRPNTMQAAEAETTVKLLYDAKNLYVLVVSQESTLDIIGQRRHEFAARIEQRDGPVEEDDAVVMLLDPGNTGASAFEFILNALGTISDARGTSPDFRETRDLSWNSGAKAAGHKGDGRWTVELAIPSADLGGAPRAGDVWRAAFGRIAHTRDEATSWNPSGDTIHRPVTMGTLVFVESTAPGIALAAPAALQLGTNELAAALLSARDAPSGVYLSVHLTAPDAKRRFNQYEFVEIGDKLARVARSFELTDQGRQQVVYGVLDAATLRPLYMSPVLSRVPRSALAQVRLAADGPFKLYLNGDLIGKGDTAPDEPIPAPLQRGVNTFAMILEKGTAAIEVSTPDGSKFHGERWKVAPQDATTAPTAAALDDGAFAMVTKTGDEHPQFGAVVGRSGAPVTLRRTLLWESTRVWPTPDPAYFLAQGPHPQHINVVLAGIDGRPLAGWTTWIATPPAFEIVGASGFYANRFRCKQEGMREVQGRQMRVVKIEAGSPVLTGQHYINSMFNVFVRYRAEAGEPKTLDHPFYFWSEANGGNVSEPAQDFTVRLLPPLNGRQPAKTFWEFWGGWESNMNDPAMREEIYKCAQAVGFNRLHGVFEKSSARIALGYNLKSDGVVDFNPWGLNLATYLEAHPEHRLTTSSGQPARRGTGGAPNLDLMCASHVLDEGRPAIEAGLKKLLDETGAHLLKYDYEYPPWQGPHSCYCARCLGAFREHAKLAANTALDAKIIRESHAAAWADFTALRMAQVCLTFKQVIKKLSPGTQFSIYSGYQTPEVLETEGIDWRYIGKLRACDIAVCGYGRPVEAIAATREALNGIPLAGGVIVYPYNTWETRPAVAVTKANVLRTMLDCRGGVMFYDRLPMDGRSWIAIAEVSRLVAEYEDLFVQGKLRALNGHDPSHVQALDGGNITLVCAMNTGDKPVSHTIDLAENAGAGREFYTGAKVSAGQSVSCTLAPGDAAVWILGK